MGLVIQPDQFPDKLFAPAKREDLLLDGQNPVYDKEMRSEIFAQGTLMLRIVIQVSILLAVPLMGACLFIMPELSPWYICYVVLFNMLVGPVFSAGSVTSERERETLDLLLTTNLSPRQILWAKLISGLRVSSVLTSFLLWPLLLAGVLVHSFQQAWFNWVIGLLYVVVVAITCVATATIALYCSVWFRRTSVSLMTSYLVIATLFTAPLAARFFALTFFPGTAVAQWVAQGAFISPLATAFALPVDMGLSDQVRQRPDWIFFGSFLAFYALLIAALFAACRGCSKLVGGSASDVRVERAKKLRLGESAGRRRDIAGGSRAGGLRRRIARSGRCRGWLGGDGLIAAQTLGVLQGRVGGGKQRGRGRQVGLDGQGIAGAGREGRRGFGREPRRELGADALHHGSNRVGIDADQ